MQFLYNAGIFLGLIWGRITAPSQLKNEHKLPKMESIIPNFLVLHFGENFMKTEKIQVNENMFSFTFYANFHEFLSSAIKQQMLYTANILSAF